MPKSARAVCRCDWNLKPRGTESQPRQGIFAFTIFREISRSAWNEQMSRWTFGQSRAPSHAA